MIWLGYRLQLRSVTACQHWLSIDEYRYAQQLGAKRAQQFSNGRALARQLLQQRLTLPQRDIDISLPAEQAPTLQVQAVPWQLSISHSGNAVAVAVSPTQQLGVDIERLKPRQFADFCQQYPALAGATDAEHFYRAWTAAEACSKYHQQPLLDLLQQPTDTTLAHYYLPLPGYMLCLVHSNNLTDISIYGDEP